jgi:hypothetical protein
VITIRHATEKYRVMVRSGYLYRGEDIDEALAIFLRAIDRSVAKFQSGEHTLQSPQRADPEPIVEARDRSTGRLLAVLYGVGLHEFNARKKKREN